MWLVTEDDALQAYANDDTGWWWWQGVFLRSGRNDELVFLPEADGVTGLSSKVEDRVVKEGFSNWAPMFVPTKRLKFVLS